MLNDTDWNDTDWLVCSAQPFGVGHILAVFDPTSNPFDGSGNIWNDIWRKLGRIAPAKLIAFVGFHDFWFTGPVMRTEEDTDVIPGSIFL